MAVIEYVKQRARSLRVPASDEEELEPENLGKSHPLVAFCEDFAAEIGQSYLGHDIDGLNAISRRQLVAERRRLQRREQSPELQKVLFHLESIAQELTTASYTRGEEDTEEFVRNTFPRLLEAIVRWLDTTDEPAADTARSALDELKSHLGLDSGQ